MDLKALGVELCIKYILPTVKNIIKSAISKIGKSLYEKLNDRFKSALESFGEAVEKMVKENKADKLKKRITCCRLGFVFFEKVYRVLEELLPEYSAAIQDAENRLEKLNGGHE